MKITRQQLSQWINLEGVTTQHIADVLTNAGLEVDSISSIAAEFTGVIVAEVKSCERHPDADKLSVCQISTGKELVQVVCGASNVRANIKIALAMVGGELPGLTIKKAKLRGVESHGMCCSAKELGMAEESEGILILDDAAPVGVCVREYLALNDDLIDIDLTPNRGDCFSVKGVARELSALLDRPLKNHHESTLKPTISDVVTVNVQTPVCCPRYVACVIKLDNTVPTPIWLQEHLRRAGLRSINLVVDVLNWVMWNIGQPMHAFDFDRLKGGITVRKAVHGSTLTLLDESEITLDDDDLIIADESGPIALAGVMGGFESSVTTATTTICLESAFFKPATIAKSSLRHHLQTDAAQRFARGVDFELPKVAIATACDILRLITPIEVGVLSIVESEKDLPVRDEVRLSLSDVNDIAGFELTQEAIEKQLTQLNLKHAVTGHDFFVKPPSYRFDLSIPEDIVEEILRLYGYDNIPEMPLVTSAISKTPSFDEYELKTFFANKDYHEAITYSFIPKKIAVAFAGSSPLCELMNPISQEMAIMRPSLWPSLLMAASYNLKRQQNRVRLFEIGKVYQRDASGFNESMQVAGLITGPRFESAWCNDAANVDFFDLKADIESVLSVYRLGELRFVQGEHPSLHPGQSLLIEARGRTVGALGLLHPNLQKVAGIKADVYLFELSLSVFNEQQSVDFMPVSKFPMVRRDFALIVDQKVTASELIACIQTHSDESLLDTIIFDVYTGEGVTAGKKSVAIGLILQDSSKTLTDEDVNVATDRVLKALALSCGAILREQ